MGVFDDVEDIGKVARDVARDVAGSRAPLASPVLDAGRLLIAGMRKTTGSGTPESGEPFRHGAVRFTGAAETVSSAHPGGEWQGAGAEAYAATNRRQSEHAMLMAVLDRDVQAVIAREAHQVAHHRARLDDQSDHLGSLSYATSAIGRIPGVGEAMKAAFELSAVKIALGVCSEELDELSQEVGDNAAQLQHLAGRYSALTHRKAAPVEPDGLPGQPSSEDPTTSESTDPAADQPLPVADPPPPTAAGATDPPPTTDVAGVAPAPAGGPAQPETAPVMPAEAMSGMSSAFGLVGGMIGSIVAPMAAVMTGVAGAVSESLSTLTAAGGPDTDGLTSDEVDDRMPNRDRTDDGADRDAAAAGSDAGGVPPAGAADSPGPAPPPADNPAPERPPAPPAPTRPPQ
ncbi:ESX-1 secretion-associated protein EspE [Mycolicibacterium vanbaalenii]|uniref:ESX-1 secretion-associated protein EspE n=1 Tax=Mycolicibacterium vanbaalenii TaxID=110539 RepID=A0A5S9QY07_MYCVN|nr:EspA/EspE family type VII secretion system effector [Mycolicibacterium vanbaalenii]CAA0124366.1 ESX-1 secretion-associated protein EspE [Mycolicibacterium vanbaalenii]